MFGWSRAVGDNELVLWQLTQMIRNSASGISLAPLNVAGVVRGFVAHVNDDSLILGQQISSVHVTVTRATPSAAGAAGDALAIGPLLFSVSAELQPL